MKDALRVLLKEHETALANAWFERMLGSYPEETRRYFSQVEKTYTNPVGANLKKSLESILAELLKDEPQSEAIHEHMQMILRIKATQEVLASQAVSFIPAFKQIVMEVVGEQNLLEKAGIGAVLDFYEDLDTVALYAFDIYVESRELLYELRIQQIKETNDILIRANLVDEKLDMSTFMRCSTALLDDKEANACAGCSSCQEPKTTGDQ